MSGLHELDIRCPYCGEPLQVQVDASGGEAQWVEDCQVCCRPMELALYIADDGAISLLARTDDDA
ncbi:CPXCG motif-containing cysteine-rich protein [Lysobacter sp. A3-1-A15]|uniref:CPXCG motif-containing cysteine-rich protein n=1 Tax=Novilysobacter viscosus TaxID=3098602 RepID=UPI002ED808D6